MKLTLVFLVLYIVAYVACQDENHADADGQKKQGESNDHTSNKKGEEEGEHEHGKPNHNHGGHSENGNQDTSENHNEGDKHADKASKHAKQLVPKTEGIVGPDEIPKSIFSWLN